MKCSECDEITRKYKCPKCDSYSCSFECFKVHKNHECTQKHPEPEQKIGTSNRNIHPFTTDDTVDPNILAQLGTSEPLKSILRNRHLRDFLRDIDTSGNANRSMKLAMLEPLFIEFADVCMQIVEPK